MTNSVAATDVQAQRVNLANLSAEDRDFHEIRQLIHNLLTEVNQDVESGLTGRPGHQGPALAKPEGQFNIETYMGLLEKLNLANAEIQAKMGKSTIKANNKKLQEMHRKVIDSIKKIMAKKRRKKKKGLFGKIFRWVAAAAMLVAAAAAMTVSFGAAAPLLVAASLNMTMLILEETGKMDEMMKGIAKMMKAFGAGDKADEAAKWFVFGVVMAVSIAAMFSGAGAFKALDTMSKIQKIGFGVMIAAEAIGGGATIGEGVVAHQQAELGRDIWHAQKDKTKFAAFLAKLQSKMADEMELLEKAVEDTNQVWSTMMAILKGHQETTSTMIQRMSPA